MTLSSTIRPNSQDPFQNTSRSISAPQSKTSILRYGHHPNTLEKGRRGGKWNNNIHEGKTTPWSQMLTVKLWITIHLAHYLHYVPSWGPQIPWFANIGCRASISHPIKPCLLSTDPSSSVLRWFRFFAPSTLLERQFQNCIPDDYKSYLNFWYKLLCSPLYLMVMA